MLCILGWAHLAISSASSGWELPARSTISLQPRPVSIMAGYLFNNIKTNLCYLISKVYRLVACHHFEFVMYKLPSIKFNIFSGIGL